MTPDQFFSDHDGRKPLHIPATDGEDKRALLNWDTFNSLLGQASLWTHTTLQLIHNGSHISPEAYCAEVQSLTGPIVRPSPAKVQVMMAMGATVIANEAGDLTPELRAVCDMLRERFAASVAANLYCSFQGVRGFGPHYDLHDVFAIQTEGEKIWRLYQNRAECPVDYPGEGEAIRDWMARNAGPVMTEVRMRPGDVLYLPRGWYHDALAVDGPSLHVTLSVTPLYGRILFRLLEPAALQDPAFRNWLPPADRDGGAALSERLADLGRRLSQLAASPAFRDEIAMAQQRLRPRAPAYDLPRRQTLTFYVPTGLAAPATRGPARVAIDWAMAQSRFALEDMIAQFDFISETDLRAAVEGAEKAGALRRA